MTSAVRIGLLRLVDSAPVMIAEQRGLFTDLGLEVTLSIEPSWSNTADKLAYGLLDAAVMLPPLALAATMGLRGAPARLLVPMGLSQGGNTIVLGRQAPPVTNAPSGAHLLAWLRAQSIPPRFAVVHRFSTHNLLLRYWLALAGADPERDIDTVVVPPEQVVEALASGRIAGFCAGAPWGDVAEQSGAGQILLGTSSIWPFHPEKCLAVNATWAEANPDTLRRLLRALLRAQIICDLPEETARIAALMANPEGLNLPESATRAALPGGSGAEQIHFHGGAAWFPARAHAVWFLQQMRRWGWIEPGVDLAAVAHEVYRPDLLAGAAVEEESLFFALRGRSPPVAFPGLPEEAGFGVLDF
jgi:NitT/TauT family transport system ATP-binding protein/nitrate/nitrite transport system substrate-binding protein